MRSPKRCRAKTPLRCVRPATRCVASQAAPPTSQLSRAATSIDNHLRRPVTCAPAPQTPYPAPWSAGLGFGSGYGNPFTRGCVLERSQKLTPLRLGYGLGWPIGGAMGFGSGFGSGILGGMGAAARTPTSLTAQDDPTVPSDAQTATITRVRRRLKSSTRLPLSRHSSLCSPTSLQCVATRERADPPVDHPARGPSTPIGAAPRVE